MRKIGNDQHVSLEANVFGFPFIFFNLSGFSNLLVLNHISSQGAIYLRLLPYTIPKQYCVLLELYIELEYPGRQNAAQLTIWNKALCYCTTTRTRCVSIFSKDDRNFFLSDK